MTSDSREEQIISNLIGIGIFLVGKRPNFKKNPKLPEFALTESVELAKQDMLILHLIHTWIMKNHSLLQAEVLKKAIDVLPSNVERAIFAGLLSCTGEKRFLSVLKSVVPADENSFLEIDKTMSLAARIGQAPYDLHMLRFGIKMTELSLEAEKKFFKRSEMIRMNPFIKSRILFGVNSRADVATLMRLGFETPYAIKAVLKNSYETAYRNFHSLKEAGWPEMNNAS